MVTLQRAPVIPRELGQNTESVIHDAQQVHGCGDKRAAVRISPRRRGIGAELH